MRNLLAAAAASLLLATSATAQTIAAVRMATFTAQSSGSIVRARELFSLSVTQIDTNQDGYLLGFLTADVPPDGPVQPAFCFYVGTGPNTTSLSTGSNPASAPTGLSWAFSIADTCSTKQAAPVQFVSIAFR